MKKQYFVLLLVLLAALILPAVFAEDENATPAPTATPEITPTPEETPEPTPFPEGIDPETGEPIMDMETSLEIESMGSGIGAQVRLLQLEKSILKRVIAGEQAIEWIKANRPATDVNNLEAILAELKTVKDEVKAEYDSVKANGVDGNTVKAFVDLKNDARSLVKQFRDAGKDIVVEQGYKEFMKALEGDAEVAALTSEIKEAAQEFNAQRLEEFFSKLEESQAGLIAKVRSGEITLKEAKDQIKEFLKGLDSAPKGKAFQWLKEAGAKKRVFGQAKAQEAKNQFLERRVNRLQERIEDLNKNPRVGEVAQNIMDRVKERIQGRIHDMNLGPHGQNQSPGDWNAGQNGGLWAEDMNQPDDQNWPDGQGGQPNQNGGHGLQDNHWDQNEPPDQNNGHDGEPEGW
ncbi:MAG: hypothetical protein NT067_03595 [Candidatus Diapherotrites archaeon]|nr:hypothetical protein [Candidatus Diapherotrites archaeon]